LTVLEPQEPPHPAPSKLASLAKTAQLSPARGESLPLPFKPRQHVHRVDTDFGDGVAAFHAEERRFAQPGDGLADPQVVGALQRSDEIPSALQSLMRNSYT